MDEEAKKTALRMITYGLYVLGVENQGQIETSTITWLTQTSFHPPLVAMGLKKDGRPYELLKKSKKFAVSFLEAGQNDIAKAFFKRTVVEGKKINGYLFETASTGAPIISDAPAWAEGAVVNVDESGDHAVVIGKIVNAGVKRKTDPLTLKELGLNYGG